MPTSPFYQLERSLRGQEKELNETTCADIEAQLKATDDAIAAGDAESNDREMQGVAAATDKMAEYRYKICAEVAQPAAAGSEAGTTARQASGKHNMRWGIVGDTAFEEAYLDSP